MLNFMHAEPRPDDRRFLRIRQADMEDHMNAESVALSAQMPKAFLPIFIGGLVAGSLDLTSAFIIYGSGVPRVIAGGLLGPKAFQGGSATYVLGIVLHFFIAL